VGSNGRNSDGGVFANSSFAHALANEALNMPVPKPLLDLDKSMPFVIVADDAFALNEHIMKPFPGRNLLPSQRIFNYRLSRARRKIENAFGIMTARFRVLRSPIQLDAAKTTIVTKACVVLHNMLMGRSENSYALKGFLDYMTEDGAIIDGAFRQHFSNGGTMTLEPSINRNATQTAREIRKEFKNYFMSTGEVPWQFKRI